MDLVDSSVWMLNSRGVSLKGYKRKLQKPFFQSNYKIWPREALHLEEKREIEEGLTIHVG
jgi:hypothetical protein